MLNLYITEQIYNKNAILNYFKHFLYYLQPGSFDFKNTNTKNAYIGGIYTRNACFKDIYTKNSYTGGIYTKNTYIKSTYILGTYSKGIYVKSAYT